MQYTVEQIKDVLGAQVLGKAQGVIDWILTDSRSLSFPESTMFFAIRSQKNDGHKYIPELYRRGVRTFVIEDDSLIFNSQFPEACFLKVDSTIKALQQLGADCRKAFDIPVIAISGSNGKTIVKEWLNQLLSPSMRITRSPRSYNSQVGVPLSVWLLNNDTQVGVFEAGISMVGEMDNLKQIIQPTIGVLTNIGQAHQENFVSMEEKCLEKLKLFEDCEVLIYNADSSLIQSCIEKKCIPHSFRSDRVLPWSRINAESPLYISKVEKKEQSTCISYCYWGKDGEIIIPFIDDASVENAIHCLAVCLYLHLPMNEIAARMQQLEPIAMRLEVKEGRNNCLIINDSYNSDYHSLDIALDFMNRRPDPKGRKRTLILSDILQTGQVAEHLYKQVAQLVENRNIDKLIGIGEEISLCASLFKCEAYFFSSTQSFLDSEVYQSLGNEMILLKGARQFQFEKITEQLELRVHETILEVNLNAIVDNYNHYRSFLKQDTKMVCMVKASAYGSGALEVSKTLQDCGVDYLAVAVADEGADLRKGGITSNIIIVDPEMTAFKTMFDYKLEAEVYNFEILDALIHAAHQYGVTNFPVHVKLDTGMHRLGFNPETDMEKLIDRLKSQNEVIPRSVFSHFVGSDSADFDAFSQRQFDLFKLGSEKLQAAFSHKILRHICNTAGIERFPERHMDMVRLGLGLYGINPIDNKGIHNVATLKSTILQIREVPANDSVGYSRRSYVKCPSRIAAIPIGYADGLNRHLGNGKGYCLVNGQKAPYIGNICMDVCMIDVTHVNCKEGDVVEIFGDKLPASTLAEWLDTIPYEILTNVGSRVKRVYFRE